jgi:ATP-dependent DNA ligase
MRPIACPGAEALGSLAVRSIILHAEAACCARDGNPDFDKLHSNAFDREVFLYAFDLLELMARITGNSRSKKKREIRKRLGKSDGIQFSGQLE